MITLRDSAVDVAAQKVCSDIRHSPARCCCRATPVIFTKFRKQRKQVSPQRSEAIKNNNFARSLLSRLQVGFLRLSLVCTSLRIRVCILNRQGLSPHTRAAVCPPGELPLCRHRVPPSRSYNGQSRQNTWLPKDDSAPFHPL
jgi:hypothetical protein